MAIELLLEKMPLAKKPEVMEMLWADLSSQSANLRSLDSHKAMLDERQRRVSAGELKFLDCKRAIADLQEELRGDSFT